MKSKNRGTRRANFQMCHRHQQSRLRGVNTILRDVIITTSITEMFRRKIYQLCSLMEVLRQTHQADRCHSTNLHR